MKLYPGYFTFIVTELVNLVFSPVPDMALALSLDHGALWSVHKVFFSRTVNML